MTDDKRLAHRTIAGDPDEAIKYGLTVMARCGLRFVPKTTNVSGFDDCPECHAPGPLRTEGQPHWVYRHYDASDRLIYVGCSGAPKTRNEQHRATTWWFDQVARSRYTVYPNREYALEMERQAIAAENPKWNIRHRDRALWDADDYRDFYFLISQNGANTRRMDKVRDEAQRRYGIDLMDMEASA